MKIKSLALSLATALAFAAAGSAIAGDMKTMKNPEVGGAIHNAG